MCEVAAVEMCHYWVTALVNLYMYSGKLLVTWCMYVKQSQACQIMMVYNLK